MSGFLHIRCGDKDGGYGDGVTVTVCSIPEAATGGLAGRASVETFGGIVASHSQSPLTCPHVSQLELPDELHDPAAVRGLPTRRGRRSSAGPSRVRSPRHGPIPGTLSPTSRPPMPPAGPCRPNCSGEEAALDVCVPCRTACDASLISQARCASPA